MASAVEAEVSGTFHNGKTAITLRISINELGFPQPPTPIKTDNFTAEGIITATVIKKFQGNGYDILLDEGWGKTKVFLDISIRTTDQPLS